MTPHGSRAPLHLLLVAGGNTIPAWLFRCLEELEHSGTARVVVVLQPVHTAGRGLRRLLFWAYQHLDRHLFRRHPDALAPIPMQSALPNRRVFERADLRSATLARALGEERIDVVLDPFSMLPEGCLDDLAPYGVWSTNCGESGDPKTQSAPGFWEVVEGRPSETRLCVRSRRWEGTLSLYVSVAPSDRRSVSRSQNHVYWKISAALVRRMQMLWEDPNAFLERLETAPRFAVAHSPALRPGNVAVLRAGAALVRRYASDKSRETLYQEQWALAYHLGAGDPLEIGGFRKLMPPMDRFWADPFPIQVGNDHYIFHEELRAAAGKGSIVLTVVDDHSRAGRPIPILETDYHLSYPFVFQWDGDFFMIPETASQRRVELYRCVNFPAQWKLERVVLPGIRALDPTPAFLLGRWWLFANLPAYGAGTWDELHVFHADSPIGPWTPHRDNPIKSDARSARPAGRIFENHGQFYRPAQDCSTRYGSAVSINRIVQLDPENYDEVEVGKVGSNWGPEVEGVHTFNVAGDMIAIDCLLRRRKFWDRLARRGPALSRASVPALPRQQLGPLAQL